MTKVDNKQSPHVETWVYLFTKWLEDIKDNEDLLVLVFGAFQVLLSVHFFSEQREGERCLPSESQTEEWEEQTRCGPLLWNEETSGHDRTPGEEETMGGEWDGWNAAEEQSTWLHPFPFHQEYETTRKELESVKKEREEAKKNLSSLRRSQAPMVKKIREIEEQQQPLDDQIKAKV